MEAIIDRVVVTGAQYINFIAPNHVLITHKEKYEYTYLKTAAFLSHSILLTRPSALNIQKFLRIARSERHRVDSDYYGCDVVSMVLKEETIILDNDEDHTFQFDSGMIGMDTISPLNEKVAELEVSDLDADKAFLKIDSNIILTMPTRVIMPTRNQLKANNHLNQNKFFMLNDELAFEKISDSKKNNNLRLLTTFPEQHYVLYDRFKEQVFPLLDIDILSLVQFCSCRLIDEIVIIPYDSYYIVEAHTDEMVYKSRMKMNSDK